MRCATDNCYREAIINALCAHCAVERIRLEGDTARKYAMMLHEFRRDGLMLAWLQKRPTYCDRGRYHANINVPVRRSDADPWPRYYFNLTYAKDEVESYLRAKNVDVSGAEWKAVPA